MNTVYNYLYSLMQLVCACTRAPICLCLCLSLLRY